MYALNCFYKERYNKAYDVKDYWVYEFAKVRERTAHSMKVNPTIRPSSL